MFALCIVTVIVVIVIFIVPGLGWAERHLRPEAGIITTGLGWAERPWAGLGWAERHLRPEASITTLGWAGLSGTYGRAWHNDTGLG